MLYFKMKVENLWLQICFILKKLYNQAIVVLLRFYTSTSVQDPDHGFSVFDFVEGYRQPNV